MSASTLVTVDRSLHVRDDEPRVCVAKIVPRCSSHESPSDRVDARDGAALELEEQAGAVCAHAENETEFLAAQEMKLAHAVADVEPKTHDVKCTRGAR